MDWPTSGPKGLNTHSHSEQPQPQKMLFFDPYQFATHRLHGHLKIWCRYAPLENGVALVFDGAPTTKAALFIALSEVLPSFLNTHQSRSE
jgi:hypothetical protein